MPDNRKMLALLITEMLLSMSEDQRAYFWQQLSKVLDDTHE